MAREARELARESVGEHVHLRNVELGKYAGRVIADVFTEPMFSHVPDESPCQLSGLVSGVGSEIAASA